MRRAPVPTTAQLLRTLRKGAQSGFREERTSQRQAVLIDVKEGVMVPPQWSFIHGAAQMEEAPWCLLRKAGKVLAAHLGFGTQHVVSSQKVDADLAHQTRHTRIVDDGNIALFDSELIVPAESFGHATRPIDLGTSSLASRWGATAK